MPTYLKIIGYGGNGVLFCIGLIAMTAASAFWPGLFMAALGGLNVYIIRKVDLYSREEVWLEAEVHKRELIRQIAEMDKEAEGEASDAAEPDRVAQSPEQQERS